MSGVDAGSGLFAESAFLPARRPRTPIGMGPPSAFRASDCDDEDKIERHHVPIIRFWYRRGAWLIVAIIGFLLVSGAALPNHKRPASGGISANASDTPDHDDALNARARGEILPLETILQMLTQRKGDRLVDVVLQRPDGRWVYQVTWLTKTGRYRIFSVDAKDGQVLKDETK